MRYRLRRNREPARGSGYTSLLATPRVYQRHVPLASDGVVTPDGTNDRQSTGGLTQGDYGLEPKERSFTIRRLLVVAGLLAFASFWFWALFLIDKTSVNKFEDRAWAENAEEVCAPVKLAVRRLDLEADPDLRVRADLIVQGTDMYAAMIDELASDLPDDPKGASIVPDWIADWRTLIQDRYDYADEYEAGNEVPFTETAVEGVPITERLETFAADNEMTSCAPPRRGVLS